MDPVLVKAPSAGGKGLVVERVQGASAAPFAGMTFPIFRRLLDGAPVILYPEEGDQRLVRPLLVGAREAGQPVGLAVAALAPGADGDAELLSVFVSPGARRRGVGATLLGALEGGARSEGCRRLYGTWMTSAKQLEAIEGLLARCGWAPPHPRMLVVKFTVEEAQTVRWYGRYQLRAGLEFLPWLELGAERLARLEESHAARPWIPPDLLPWRHDPDRLEPHSSIAALLDGEVVGWVINHRLGEDLVRFTTAFMRRDLARRGRLVPLFSESIRRLDETPLRRCMFTTPLHHREMVAFVERHCKRWVSFVGHTRGSFKDLEKIRT
jgi:GNAT superfamily N-acetyltransferase